MAPEEDPRGAEPAVEEPTNEELRAVADVALQRMREARAGLPWRRSARAPRAGVREAVEEPASRAATRWRKAPGMAASRTRWNEPAAVGVLIDRVGHQRGWDGPAAMGSVMVKWPVIVGVDVSEHCHVETFEDHRLIVRCSSTAWAKQLQLLLPHIERRIDEEVGPGVVTQVIVRGPAAPSWRKGRFVVEGRGPRDTYA